MLHPMLLSLALAAAGAPVVWDFETPDTGWRARADSVKVERVVGRGATPESRSTLHIHGSMAENYNYALSDSHPMQGGSLYRLSAWVRVDRLGSSTPPPFLKCEFVAADEARSPGRTNTDPYDVTRLGTWQKLTAEFRAPADTVRCWVALEKGTPGLAEIDAYLDDVRIEPIARLTAFERYRLNPTPPALEARRGVHPRLYLNEERLAALRVAINGTHAGLWREVKEQADRAAAAAPPAYRETPDGSGNEQLWQRDVGSAMPPL
ncbi:MAG: carbohydrate binding domain-containing protein, partial [Armatimonadota bacterium]|nr:carbohydrate binding domain-containing protein [Armatimonadota bacterium]